MRQQQMQMEAQRQREAQRDAMLAQLLTSEARERRLFNSITTQGHAATKVSHTKQQTVARVALVKPENARAVGDIVIQNAMSGRIQARVDENELIRLLEQVSQHLDKHVTVEFVRRRVLDEDDDSEDEHKEAKQRDDDDDDDDE